MRGYRFAKNDEVWDFVSYGDTPSHREMREIAEEAIQELWSELRKWAWDNYRAEIGYMIEYPKWELSQSFSYEVYSAEEIEEAEAADVYPSMDRYVTDYVLKISIIGEFTGYIFVDGETEVYYFLKEDSRGEWRRDESGKFDEGNMLLFEQFALEYFIFPLEESDYLWEWEQRSEED